MKTFLQLLVFTTLLLIVTMLGHAQHKNLGKMASLDDSTGVESTVSKFSPFVTKEKDTLRIHFLSGSDEYDSESSLMKLKQILEQKFENVKVTASWGRDEGKKLPDIALLDDADLMVVFTRRMTLPEDEMAHLLQYIQAEKPVIGIRTASHAFQNHLEFDAQVLGGDYQGHGPDERVKVILAENADLHPVLKNISAWTRAGKMYQNPELGTNTQTLLYGKGLESGKQEPLAWTNIYGETGRSFYTSMGLPTDFENKNFQQLLFNAITWTTKQNLNPKN